MKKIKFKKVNDNSFLSVVLNRLKLTKEQFVKMNTLEVRDHIKFNNIKNIGIGKFNFG